jgi:signal transduction histidine kinase
VEDKIIGTVSYAHSRPGFFQDKDQKLLLVVGDQLAVSIERLLYQRELERKNQILLKMQKELKAVQKSRIDSEKLEAVRQLAVSINHEINNPLSVIVGNIQCLLFTNKDLDKKVVERLKTVEEESLKIAQINRRLLKIEDLVSETYIGSGNKIKMINLQKSSAGV